LVKDGAVAIETLGDSIDASLLDLKGGTTGQVLAKASGTDMDFTWTAIDPLVILDAKGDLITATAADTPARLAVGTNGQTLVADSTTATGLKWATAASGSTFVGASAYDTGTLTVANTTWTRITYNSEAFDTDSIHSTATNTGRFTIPTGKTGKWLSSMNIQCEGTTSAVNIFIQIYLNGTGIGFTKLVCPGGVGAVNFPFSQVLSLTAGDYIEFYIYHNNGSNRDFYSGTSQAAFGQVSYLGA
jgi:hypothetical protein